MCDDPFTLKRSRLQLLTFALHVLADQLVGEILVLIGNVEQLLAAPLILFGLRGLTHLCRQGAVVLRARQIVLHRPTCFRCDG